MRKPIGKIKDRKVKAKQRRKLSARKKVTGTESRPRICVNKTNKNLFVQAIDDLSSKTLFTVQTFGKNKVANAANIKDAGAVGSKVAEELLSRDFKQVVFDRSGAKYTGIITVIADTIREKGVSI